MDPVSTMTHFEYRPQTGLIFGPGTLNRAPKILRELESRSILLVTDPGIVRAGHAFRLQRLLEEASYSITVFDRVEENPSTQCVRECAETASDSIDTIIALGGGSSIDTGKGASFLLTNGGRMEDYWGFGKTRFPLKPIVAIPTTAGTGSEVQSYALISDEKTHRKMACGDPGAAPRFAILDPELTLTQPAHVTATTGIDTLAHAVESAVTRKRNPLSTMYSHRAFQLTVEALPRVLQNPDDLEERGKMLLAASLAGSAIENSMLGAAHASGNPLTALCGIVHGQAVGMMLPRVVRYNAADPQALACYFALAQAGGLAGPKDNPAEAIVSLIECLERILELAGVPVSLEAYGIDRSHVPELADAAAQEWTGRYNPRPIDAEGFRSLYEAALG